MPVDLNDIEVVSSPGTQTGGVGPDDYEVVSTPTPPSFTTDQGSLGEAIANPPPAPTQNQAPEESLGSEALGVGSEALKGIGDLARAGVSDVAAGLSLFHRPQNVPNTLLPSPANISSAVRQNMPYAAAASGNIPAALTGQPLPIDETLKQAAEQAKSEGRFPTEATIGKLSEDLAATAPLAAIGALPAAAQKVIMAGFTAKMIADAPQIATALGNELGKPKDQQDPDKISSLVSSAIQTTGFSIAGALGTMHGLRGGTLEPSTEGVQNAPEIRKKSESSLAEYPGTALGTDLSAYSPKVREEGRTSPVSGNRPSEGGIQPEEAQSLEGASPKVQQIMRETGMSEDDAQSVARTVISDKGVAKPTTPEPQAGVESNVTPEVRAFTDRMTDNTQKFPNTNDAQAAGAKVKSIADLDHLMEVQRVGTTKARAASSEMKTASGAEAMDAIIKKHGGWATGGSQMPREAIEFATNSGSGRKGIALNDASERPLDWRKNPEVRDWLVKNSKELWPTPSTGRPNESRKMFLSEVENQPHEIMGQIAKLQTQRADATMESIKVGGDAAAVAKPFTDKIEALAKQAGFEKGANVPMRPAPPQTQVERFMEQTGRTQKEAEALLSEQPKKIKSYGEKYVEESGVDGAQKRVDHLQARISEELAKRPMSQREIENLQDESENLSKAISAAKNPTGKKPQAIGPGAKTSGEPPYSAIQQLSDQINQTPKVGGRESLRLNEAAADKWAKGKSSVEQAIGKMIAIKSSLASIARGVRTPTDLDAKIGSLDWALQRSSAQSKAAGEAIRRQVPNEDMRNAAAIWVDAGGDEAAIKDALSKLPEGTPPKVRRAVEQAANLPPEIKQFSESLKQYFGIRQNDAVSNEIFEQGLEDYFTHIWKNEDNMPGSVKSLINSGRVSTYFQFGRQRKIGTFLEGILEGKTPELDPSKVVPFYNYLLDRSIASRRFIKEASDLTAADGRPVLAPTGIAKPVEKGTTDETLFINPRAKAEETADYKPVDHPALRKWKWAATDESGKQTFYQSDLLVHPDHLERLARMMDRGRLTATKTGAALLRAGSEVKGLKLGLLSLFHQVHVGSHALWHWTDPIGAARNPINWEAPETQYAIEKGHLKLAPNPSELMQFEEGIISPGLVHKIPIIGPWSKAYGQWLFGEYIPRLKLATFQNALKRGETAYKGKLSPDEIAARTGDAVNNAYGELNQLFLGKNGRDPRFQRLLRGVFLAPDFGEARLNFVEKAFTKYGHEERLALATMFLTMYTTARFANWMSHGDPEWDLKRAFMVKSGDHWWTMRSVAGDAVHAVTDFGGFMRNRLSPLFGRTALELLTGRDSSGIKRTMPQQLTDLTKQGIPISMNGLTRSDQHIWESFVSSMGLSTIRDTPQQDVNNLVSKWKSKSINPKLQAQVERAQKETMAPSDYSNLRLYLQWGDEKKASAELQKLLQIKSREDVRKALLPNKPFTGSWKYEESFKNTLTPPQLQEYDRAKQQRQQIYERFQGLTSQKPGATIQPQNNGYQIGQVVAKDGKNWKVDHFEPDGEPFVYPTTEPVTPIQKPGDGVK